MVLPFAEMMTGQSPGVVLVPTFQVHATSPFESDVFGPRLVDRLGPLSYNTVIVAGTSGAVLTATSAYSPGVTVRVDDMTVNPATEPVGDVVVLPPAAGLADGQSVSPFPQMPVMTDA